MNEAMKELDATLKVLEASLPASVDAPANQRLVRKLERDMRDYFRNLDMALDWNALEELYYKNVKQ